MRVKTPPLAESRIEDACEASPLKGDVKGQWFSCSAWRFVGPGLLACLADTDAGCLMVAAQTGARWTYSQLLVQVLLIPVLFCAQELTVRLGIYTRKGHAACIKEHYGNTWAWITTAMLVFECILAIISEMSGIASVAQLWGVGRGVATLIAAGMVIIVVFGCRYKTIETFGVCLGLCELSFVVTMFAFHPSPGEVFRGMFDLSNIYNEEYLKLVTANIGAVIMPWMIYFQQSAVVARRLKKDDVEEERVHTFFGSCLTQMIMIATLVTFAASRAKDLQHVESMYEALLPVLGSTPSIVLLSLAFIGGSACAAFVVSLAASWAICEASGSDDSYALDRSPSEAPLFYGCFLAVIIIGVYVLQLGVDDVKLNVYIELTDGLLMPLAVGFLYLMACSPLLPPEIRVVGRYKVILGFMFGICSVISVSSGIWGLLYHETAVDESLLAIHRSSIKLH